MADALRTYRAGPVEEYNYPEAGDPRPGSNEQVSILTEGGICIRGTWKDDAGFLGWANFPPRNKEKEELIYEQRRNRASA